MRPVLRAKLRVQRVTREIDDEGNATSEIVRLLAVYGPEGSENSVWSKYTPSATFEIQITNQAAFGTLGNGHEFYVDFMPAE